MLFDGGVKKPGFDVIPFSQYFNFLTRHAENLNINYIDYWQS